MLHHFCDVKFQNQDSVRHLTEQVFHLLLQDSELPVKVDAAMGLQFLVKFQELCKCDGRGGGQRMWVWCVGGGRERWVSGMESGTM